MNPTEILSPADRAAIETAVRAAEERTGCEIVVTVVRACDAYQHAAWKAATCGALAGALATAAATRGLEVWGMAWAWLLLPAPAGAVLGWLAARSAALRRVLATPQGLQRRVAARAAMAFLDAEVFHTTARTGVLLFLAEFERQVVVLADRGVRARVPEAALAGVARAVSARLRSGRVDGVGVATVERAPLAAATVERAPLAAATVEHAPLAAATVEHAPLAAALLDGVARCAAVLEEHGFGARPASGNELADAVRVEE